MSRIRKDLDVFDEVGLVFEEEIEELVEKIEVLFKKYKV